MPLSLVNLVLVKQILERLGESEHEDEKLVDAHAIYEQDLTKVLVDCNAQIDHHVSKLGRKKAINLNLLLYGPCTFLAVVKFFKRGQDALHQLLICVTQQVKGFFARLVRKFALDSLLDQPVTVALISRKNDIALEHL